MHGVLRRAEDRHAGAAQGKLGALPASHRRRLRHLSDAIQDLPGVSLRLAAFPELDADWRPDRSGILILRVAQASLPKAYQPAGNGVQLLVTGGEAAVTRPGFAEYVVDLLSRGVGMYMTTTTPRSLLNEYLQPFAAARDAVGARRTLIHLYRLLTVARGRKGLLWMLSHFYRLHLEKWRLVAKNTINRIA